jgi:hypothetical protein
MYKIFCLHPLKSETTQLDNQKMMDRIDKNRLIMGP